MNNMEVNMKREEMIVSIEANDTIQTFMLTTDKGTTAIIPFDQIDKYQVGQFLEVIIK
jgi:hypothetical protein